MDKSLFKFIWRFSKRQQLVILAMTTLSFPILYMSLELPKWIVNDAIDGREFPKEFLGMSFDQVPYLLALCFAFLALVILNNGVKYVLNIYKGVTGERMLRRLRYLLYLQVLRFRLPHFRKVSSGEIIPMITAEVEDIGVFIAEAIATPAFQGGTLLVYIVFIFVQDPFLGAAAISLYPVQAYVIPKLQRRVVILTRERVKNVRRLSDRIGESVGGIVDIHANDTARWHLADLSDRLFTNYKIRLEIFKRKYMIKFVNNFMNQLPPFFFYSIGGYFVIRGELSFGALVAVLAAYKDLASPWKELLTWYQTMSSVTVKYEAVVENFDPEDALPLERLASEPGDERLPEGSLKLAAVSAITGGSGQDVNDVSLEVAADARMAVFGRDGSGRTELLLLMAGLLSPSLGRVEVGQRNLEELPESVLRADISYVGGEPYLFNDTIRGNVVYSLRRAPKGDPELDPDELKFRQFEAKVTGNSLHEVAAPWEDHTLAGLAHREEIDDRLLELFALVGLADDIYRLGLQARVDPEKEAALVARLLEARVQIAERIAGDSELRDLVELWDARAFNHSATVAENVLFAMPNDPATRVEQIPQDPKMLSILREASLLEDLVGIGVGVAETMLELFSGVGADNTLIGDYSFISAEEIPAFEQRLRKHGASGLGDLTDADIAAFLGIAFRLVPGRHRLVDITTERERRIIEARPKVQERLKALGTYALFEPHTYVPPLTIEDNILFGKARVDRRGASERIDGFIRSEVAALGLRDPISRAGLGFSVGVQGSRLSARQRRRVGLVRALIKRPRILVVDAVFDDEPSLVTAVLDAPQPGTLVVGTAVADVARRFARIAVMREGRLVDAGDWARVRRHIAETGELDRDTGPEREALMEASA